MSWRSATIAQAIKVQTTSALDGVITAKLISIGQTKKNSTDGVNIFDPREHSHEAARNRPLALPLVRY